MAYAVLFSLSQTIAQILNPHHQFPISDDGKKQIKSLRDQVISLKDFVEKFTKEAESLETGITTAANEAEDILEHFMYEHIRWRHKSERLAAVRKTTVEPTTDLYDLHELKMAMDEINSIAETAAAIKSSKDPPTEEDLPSSSATSDDGLVNDVTVGLEEDLKYITGLICEDSNGFTIIPITGMGGIGKTTLARGSYNDAVVKEKFPVRVWVTVSHDYKIDNIFANILESLKHVDPQIYETNDAAQDKIFRILSTRKYLVVVDDLWSINAWDDMKRIFPGGSKGNRVVITTREEEVASKVSSTPLHKMRLLEKKQGWTLLKRKVFGNNKCPSHLKETGKEIAESCGGLPLAIVLIAGILSNVPQSPDSWDVIKKDVHLALQKDSKDKFEERIALSYVYLPRYLRPCFLYMGGFPEDHEIRASKIMKLFVAEGFVRLSGDKQTLEDGAEKYLEAIVRRNLALVTTFKSNGKVKSCNVHDMVRDLSKARSLDENYERRLSINHPDLTRLARAYGSTLRSVISFQPNESSLGGLRKFRLLRLLDVVDTDAYSLPAPVFELFHLRYLAFGCPMELPTAIERLKNLRALIIRPSKRFRKYSTDEIYLPLEIWSLPELRHLFSFFDLLPNPEGTVSAPLEKLLTLSVVKKLICTEELMKMIPNIKKLGITYFGDKYKEDYQLQNLVLLQHLEKLKLVMEAKSPVQLEINPVFPKTLRKLTLSGWGRGWKTLEILSDLPDLQVLKLRDHACEGDEWVTIKDQFPSLEYLLIDTSDIKVWETGKSHFPALKRVVLYRCSWLSAIPEEIGEMSTLRVIEVDHANEDLVECVKEVQKEHEGYFGKKLKVDVVHYKGS